MISSHKGVKRVWIFGTDPFRMLKVSWQCLGVLTTIRTKLGGREPAGLDGIYTIDHAPRAFPAFLSPFGQRLFNPIISSKPVRMGSALALYIEDLISIVHPDVW